MTRASSVPINTSVLDPDMLQDLQMLGGWAFMDDIVHQFGLDARELLQDLNAAMEAGDVEAFHNISHALRSCAGNVGAQLLFDLCHTAPSVDTAWIHRQRLAHLEKVQAAFGLVEQQLTQYVASLTPEA